MLIELLTGMVTVDKTWEVGEIINLPEDEALRFIASEMGKPVEQKKETASLDSKNLIRETRRK